MRSILDTIVLMLEYPAGEIASFLIIVLLRVGYM